MLINPKITSHLSLVLLTLLLACKKDDTSPNTPEFRLFTNGMEITGATIKANFLRHAPAPFQQTVAVGATDKIVFTAPDTALFSTSSMPYLVIKNGKQFLFYSSQTVQISPATLLLNDMLKYKAPKVMNPYVAGSDYITQEVLVGYGDAKQIQLPCMQYYWTQTDGPTRKGYFGHLFNELNEDVVLKVRAVDTLAVRLSSLTIPVQ